METSLVDFKDLELLVVKIQKTLAPNAEVLHDVKVLGRKTGRKRQVDVLLKERIGQFDIQIAIECKDTKRPADVKCVETFAGLLDDVGAHKGVLVCPSGFSAAAKIRAEGLQIALYSPVDTDVHKWTVIADLPVLYSLKTAAMGFGISGVMQLGCHLPEDPHLSLEVTRDTGEALGSMFSIAVKKWNDGELPLDVGEHPGLQIFGDDPHLRLEDGRCIPADLKVNLTVNERLFFGHVPITQLTGFIDASTEEVLAKGFDSELVSPLLVWNNWTPVASIDDCAVIPVLKVSGFMFFGTQMVEGSMEVGRNS